MALSYANLLDEILLYLQDSGAAIFASTETQYGIENELKTISRYSPQIIDVIYKLESRTGADVTGTASSLTDSVKAQFVATDATEEKVVYNSTDHTWAVVLSNSSTSVNTLSADIMDANENYEIYNKRCRNKKQIFIGDMPFMWIKSVEYPIGTPRNFSEISDDVIELEVYDSIIPDSDSTLTKLNDVQVLIKFAVPQIVCQLTDLKGEVHTAGVADAKTMQIKSFTDAEIVEAGDQFTIENHVTTYTVTTGVTLNYQTAAGSNIGFYPGLEADAPGDSIICFKKSSLKPAEENFLIRLVSARACISKSTLYYAQVNTAITQCTDAATAIGDIAALITLATTASTGDIALGRAQTALGATAVTAIAAIIAKAEAASTGDIALGRAEIVKALDAIILANAEFDKIVVASTGPMALAASSLASGLLLVNTIPVGGGAAEHMGQAASNVGASQGYALSGQIYLQETSADLNAAASNFRAASLELETSGAKAREAAANFSNATSHFNAATADFKAAGEKANEAIANLRLVASRLQVSQGGLRYETWGRTELAQVESELRTYGGFPSSRRYARN